MESRTRNSIKNAMFSIAFQIVTVLANFAVKTAFIKFLGIQYAGMSALFTDILSVLSMAELGFGTAISYALYAPLYKNDQAQIKKLMDFYKGIYRVVATIVFSAGILCMPFLGYLVKDVPDIKENITLVFAFFVIQTTASYLLVYRATLLEANQQKSIVCGVGIVFSIIGVIIEVSILAIFKNYLFYLVTSVLVIIMKNIAISVVAQREFPILKDKCTEHLTKQEKNEVTKDVKALAIYRIGNTLQVSTASIIISILIDTVSVGLLSSYRLITTNIDKIFGQIFEAMKPSVGNLAVSSSTKHQYDVFKRMCFLSFFCGNLIVVATFVLVNPFIQIWIGSEYLLDMRIVMMLVTDMYILTMARPYEAFRIANRLFLKGKYRPIVMTAINLVLAIILGRRYGIFGVLLATVIARVVTHVWYDPWLIYKDVFKMPFIKYLYTKAKYLVFVFLNCILIYYLSGFIKSGSIYFDFILKTFLVAVLPSVILLLVFYKNKEMRWFVNIIKNWIKKVR